VKTPQTLAILKGLPKKIDAKYRVSTNGLFPSGLTSIVQRPASNFPPD